MKLEILIAGSLTLLLLSAPGPRAQTAKTFGVYKGNGCTAVKKVPLFAKWYGHPVTRVLDFFASNSWPSFVGDARWVIACWQKAGYKTVTFSVPMLVSDNRSTLAAGAAGAYTKNFATIAGVLVRAGYGSAVIRLGWEFNGGWYPWSAAKDPESFVKYWRVIVTAMRAVPGAHFKFDWCSALGWLSVRQDKVYPGDDVVDIIGMDVYTAWWKAADKNPQVRWTFLQTQTFGLNWLKSFAVKHGRPMSFPEWGTGTRPDGHGGGDDPYFINSLANLIHINNVVYSDYWDYHAPDYNAQVSNGNFPLSGAALKADYLKLTTNGS